MNAYDAFGSWYDVVVGERPDLADFIDTLIRRANPKAETLLELGCGSGSLLKRFAHGYRVTGVDLSPKMIELARRRVPKAHVMVGDITELALPSRFDAIVCAFDTMNHLPKFSQWKAVLAVARAHLNPGGIFIFDVNTAFKLERYRTEPPVAGFHEGAVSVVSVSKAKGSRCHYDVSLLVFEAQGGTKLQPKMYRRHELRIRELVMPQRTIVDAAKRVFRRVGVIDAQRKRPSSLSEELFFVCRA